MTTFSIQLLRLSFACMCLSVAAQANRPPVLSPDIGQNGSVTFRYDNAKAQRVEISAEFLKSNRILTKDESSGVWSIRIDSIKPDIYPYFFVIDGVTIADPANAQIFPNERFKRSLVDVPPAAPSIQDMQNVPHGTVLHQYYQSKTLGLTRPIAIYTPPGYEKGKTKYPVLYLIHGMTDTQETWIKVGHINLIMDNLIAQGKAKPMIIVMPYANPYPALLEKDRNTKVDLLNNEVFNKEVLNEIIPFTEGTFRTLPGSGNRAIAGFSLGGRQTLAAGLGNPKTFAWVCAYAPAVWKREFEESFSKSYASAADLNANLKLLWVSCGKTDFLYPSATDLISALDEKKIKYTLRYSEGGHTWMNVRSYFAETMPLLFK